MEITADVLTAFRERYPEFGDETAWPDAEVQRCLEDSIAETGGGRWGRYATDPRLSFRARGMFAYAAHRLLLARAAKKAVEGGGMPSSPAKTESKSVGDESWTYAVARPETASQGDARGDLASTYYGQEFLRLRQRAGMGAATTGTAKL